LKIFWTILGYGLIAMPFAVLCWAAPIEAVLKVTGSVVATLACVVVGCRCLDRGGS